MLNRTILVFAVLSLLMSVAQSRENSLSIDADSVIGSNIGHFIDEQDRNQILEALKSEHFTKASTWKSDRSGIAYTVKPGSLNESQQNACRDFTLNSAIGSFLKEFPGTACQVSDGNWVVVK